MEKEATLYILSGLPGTGKTTLARKLSKQLKAVFFRVDSAESALKNSVLKIHPAEDAGYQVGWVIALDNLKNGLDVVADSVNPVKLTRDGWKNVANQAPAKCLEIEVICSDQKVHKSRIEDRKADLPNQTLPTWEKVSRRDYEEWDRKRLVIDTANKSVEECVGEIILKSVR